MDEAFLVFVKTPMGGPGLRTLIAYAVLADGASRAVQLVRAERSANDDVSYSGSKLSDQTAQALGLLPGKPRQL